MANAPPIGVPFVAMLKPLFTTLFASKLNILLKVLVRLVGVIPTKPRDFIASGLTFSKPGTSFIVSISSSDGAAIFTSDKKAGSVCMSVSRPADILRVGGVYVLLSLVAIAPRGLGPDMSSVPGSPTALEYDSGSKVINPSPPVGVPNNFSASFCMLVATIYFLLFCYLCFKR